MEDYAEDMLYIAMKLNLTSLIQDITQVQNETPGKKESSATRMKDYMSQLSPEARQKLYYFYKIDFEMFEYDYDIVYDFEHDWLYFAFKPVTEKISMCSSILIQQWLSDCVSTMEPGENINTN